MNQKQNFSQETQFKLERYRYVLQQIKFVNENIYRYITLFQTLATAVIGGGVAVFVSWENNKIDAEIARVGIIGLLGLLTILALFVVLSTIAGIFTWFDYRKEEAEMLDEIIQPGYRQKPKIKNFWRWYETYIILFLIIIWFAIYLFVTHKVLPLIS